MQCKLYVMETRGRKREDKVRIVVALSNDLIEQIKSYAKQSGKNVSVFMEEVLGLKGKVDYTSVGWSRHERKKMCFRFPQETIDYIRKTTQKDKVSYESLFEAKMRLYAASPQPMLEKTAPVAIQYIVTGDDKEGFLKAFKDLCIAFFTETNDVERTKDFRKIVAQKLAIRCIRSLTDSQLLRLDKVLEEFCEQDWKLS